MLFAWILTFQLKITSFVIEFCQINTIISIYCSHFQGTYICKLTRHQNIASYIYIYIYSYIYCEIVTPCPCFVVKPATLQRVCIL